MTPSKNNVDLDNELEGESKSASAFLVALVVVAALAVFVIVAIVKSFLTAPDDPWREFLGEVVNSVGEGIGVAVVGGLILQVIFERRQLQRTRRMIKVTIEQQLAPLHVDILKSVKKLAPTYVPEVFPSTTSPDAAFNRALMRDLQASSSYYFLGTSGTWTALRMASLPVKVKSVTVVLPDTDPTGKGYTQRVRYELAVAKRRDPSRTYSDVESEWRRRIAQALAGFFVEKGPVPYRIVFLQRKFHNRVEVFDGAAYVCAFDRNDPARQSPYPETLRFDKKTFNYPLLLDAVKNSPNRTSTFTIEETTKDEELIGHLKALKLIATRLEFEQLKTDYQSFKEKNMRLVEG